MPIKNNFFLLIPLKLFEKNYVFFERWGVINKRYVFLNKQRSR